MGTEELDDRGLPPIDAQPDPAHTLFVTEINVGYGDVLHDGQPHSGMVLTTRGENGGHWAQVAFMVPHGKGMLTELRDALTGYLERVPE